LIAGFIDELILNYSIDAVSLLGFSQGYAIAALSHPEKLASFKWLLK
jgi:predicted esterase